MARWTIKRVCQSNKLVRLFQSFVNVSNQVLLAYWWAEATISHLHELEEEHSSLNTGCSEPVDVEHVEAFSRPLSCPSTISRRFVTSVSGLFACRNSCKMSSIRLSTSGLVGGRVRDCVCTLQEFSCSSLFEVDVRLLLRSSLWNNWGMCTWLTDYTHGFLHGRNWIVYRVQGPMKMHCRQVGEFIGVSYIPIEREMLKYTRKDIVAVPWANLKLRPTQVELRFSRVRHKCA